MVFAGCGANRNDETDTQDETIDAPHEAAAQDEVIYVQYEAAAQDEVAYMQHILTYEQAKSLAKLSKVWGFAKYTHHSFISGQLDWDAELLNLIPVIIEADADDVNGILYDWFVSLGHDGFDLEFGHDFTLSGQLDLWDAQISSLNALFVLITGTHSQGDMFTELREVHGFFTAMVEDGYDLDFLSFKILMEETFPEMMASVPAATGADLRQVADLSWINYDYLGPLAANLLRFNGIAAVGISASPVFFNLFSGTPSFFNQSLHTGMDFSDTGYRLLGLFRLWNTMNYYYPHIGILDVEWNDLLVKYIPKMLEDTDRHSYELTLAALSHHLRDSTHITFRGATFIEDRFGQFMVPVRLREAEGQLVVYRTSGSQSPFELGDVILRLDGRDINEVTAEMLRFLSYPTEEKALAFLAYAYHPLRSHTPDMEVDILRGDVEITINTSGITNRVGLSPPTLSFELLESNIGYIITGDVQSIMEEFADTDGIIIDLRHGLNVNFFEMRQYLMAEPLPFAYTSMPSPAHPGTRVDVLTNQFLPRSPYAFVYDRPVVVLIDERTISHGEWQAMAYRVAPNVTVMGPWSMGTNGNVTWLPLPGGIRMRYTSLGVYTPEGGQTHRIGIIPDIRVDRTIQGIAEGCDEILEAAIRFILGE